MKKRILSTLVLCAMLLSMLPGAVSAVDFSHDIPWLDIHLGDAHLASGPNLTDEGAAAQDWFAMSYDDGSGTYTVTLENAVLDQPLSFYGNWECPMPTVQLILKGENIIDVPGCGEGSPSLLNFGYADITLTGFDGNASLSLSGTDCAGITCHDGSLTVDALKLDIHCAQEEASEGGQGMNGNGDVLITGGSELNVWGQWMGFIISGGVTFEDCTVNTNRIHVHSQVDDSDPDNITSTQRTMTIGEGAVINLTGEDIQPNDPTLMLLDGSRLLIDGGILNCDLTACAQSFIQVGFDGDIAVNTLQLDSGELNITRDLEIGGGGLNLSKGRYIQNGGALTVTGAELGMDPYMQASAHFNGGTALFDDCITGIWFDGDPAAPGEAKVSVAGADLQFNVLANGFVSEGGTMSVSDGSVTVNAQSNHEDYMTIAALLCGELVMSGGTLDLYGDDFGLYLDESGVFTQLGGEVNIRSVDHSGTVAYGLVELRGGQFTTQSEVQYAFGGIPGTGDYLYIGQDMFLTYPANAVFDTVIDHDSGEWCGLYFDEQGNFCPKISFGSSGGVFSGKADVNSTDLSVGVPFVVSADLSLGEQEGNMDFAFPEGMRPVGNASVNGKVVECSYNAQLNELTVPIQSQSAAVRLYAVADKTFEDAVIRCSAYVNTTGNSSSMSGWEGYDLYTSPVTVKGLRLTLPDTVSTDTLQLSGSGTPGGLIRVYDISDENDPVLLTPEDIPVNALGSFSGTVQLPAASPDLATDLCHIRVELVLDRSGDGVISQDECIDTADKVISRSSHGARLTDFYFQNNYHGTDLDEILTNYVHVPYQDGNGRAVINGDPATRAYNYFPEHPTFSFEARFDNTEHILIAYLEAKGSKGQSETFPLWYQQDTGTFCVRHDFPDWPPVSFTVYWVEEGVVSRESVYETAIELLSSYEGSAYVYEDILYSTTDEVNCSTQEYFDNVTEVQVDEQTYEYYDADDDRVATLTLEYPAYEPGMEDGLEDVRGDGTLYMGSRTDEDGLSLTLTMISMADPANPSVVRQILRPKFITAEDLAQTQLLAATPGQRTTVFVLKQIPRVGDAVQAVDSKLLDDSLVEFDRFFSNDIAEFTRQIQTTMNYRCPYTGQEVPRSNNEAAIKALRALLDLQTEYAADYAEVESAILDDMKESLFNGVTLGVNKFGSERVKTIYKTGVELKELWDEGTEFVEDVTEFVNDPVGSLQSDLDELLTPEGMVDFAADNDLIDEDTKELLETLMDPDGTYQDAHKFMNNYRDRLTDIINDYITALQNDLDTGSNDTNCDPPEDQTPPPPRTAGGDEVPIPAILDPSGYVYEGVESNRLSGVTATLYYGGDGGEQPTLSADELGLVPWDAAPYGQGNPLTTDALGQYQWMVPEGWWQVKYTKAGYKTAYSDWLPVPPPQTGVNVELVRLTQPEAAVDAVEPYTVYLSFDRYILRDSLQVELTVNGQPFPCSVETVDTSLTADGSRKLATRFRISYPSGLLPQNVDAVLTVTEAVTYSDVSLDAPIPCNIVLQADLSGLIHYYWEEDACFLALANGDMEGAMIWAAAYADGKMTDIRPLTQEELVLSGDSVQIFFLDPDTFAPLRGSIGLDKP